MEKFSKHGFVRQILKNQKVMLGGHKQKNSPKSNYS